MCAVLDVSSGIENLLVSSSIEQSYEPPLHHIPHPQHQQPVSSTSTPYHQGLVMPTQQQPAPSTLTSYQQGSTSTPHQQGLFVPVVSRGSFTRSSASSTDGSLALTPGNVPQSSMNVSRPHGDDTTAPDAAGSTSISAKSLQREMPPGADLNDLISSVLTGRPVTVVHQNADSRTPIRKSSLVTERSDLPSSADVTRSTSLRHATRSDAEQWLPLRHGFTSTQLNVSPLPPPVEARIQRVPFASPMTVTSNPVHSASASPGHVTPPAYHPPPAYNSATNIEQPMFMTPPQSQTPHSSHFSTTATAGRPLHDSPLSVARHMVSSDRRPFFNLLTSENSANSGSQLEPPTNSIYPSYVPLQHTDTLESSGLLRETNAMDTQPCYHMAQSVKMNAVNSTPPNTRRYFDNIEPPVGTLIDFTNGDAQMHTSDVRMMNGQHEPMSDGPVPYMSTVHSLAPSSNAAADRQVSHTH